MPARIVSNPNIMLGKPVIDGTRITVELILERMAAGDTVADMVDAYPHLNAEQVRAALAYAASVLRNEVVLPYEPAAK